MKSLQIYVVGLVCLLTALSTIRTNAQSSQSANTKDLLVKIEKEWANANVTQNVATLNTILSDDLIFTTYDGKVLDKAAVLKSVKDEKIESDDLSEIVIRIYGTTAVITGRSTVKFRVQDTLTTQGFRWTDTFVKTGNVWKCVASQEVRLPE
jgi:hypothetical protein